MSGGGGGSDASWPFGRLISLASREGVRREGRGPRRHRGSTPRLGISVAQILRATGRTEGSRAGPGKPFPACHPGIDTPN